MPGHREFGSRKWGEGNVASVHEGVAGARRSSIASRSRVIYESVAIVASEIYPGDNSLLQSYTAIKKPYH